MTQYLQLYKEEEFTNEFFDEDEQTELHYFGEIKDINLLIGANNSRKSRFLRKLLRKKNYRLTNAKLLLTLVSLQEECKKVSKIIDNDPNLRVLIQLQVNAKIDKVQHLKEFVPHGDMLANIVSTFQNERTINVNSPFISEIPSNIVKYLLSDDESSKLSEYLDSKLYPLQFLSKWIDVNSELQNISSYIHVKHTSQLHFLEKIDINQIIVDLESLQKVSVHKKSPQKEFIPTLRTAINLIYTNKDSKVTKISEDIYSLTIEKNYDLRDVPELKIHTGLNLFNEIKRSRNSRRDTRKQFEAFEKFLQDNFFPGQDVEIIALDVTNKEDEHISIYIGNQERNIYDLGDGIQALIVLLYPIFMAKRESWVFIEEPEINMHPGLQNLFLRTLLTDQFILGKKLKYFITTHSNHLLYQSLMHAEKVSVFSFKNVTAEQKTKTNIRRIESSDPEVLDLLGVYNVSVLMANCCIWVEGISDRKYLMAFLTAYIRAKEEQNYIEGLHYAFFEYAGSNIRHYNFGNDEDEFKKIKAHLLSNKIFLLADRDSGEHKKEFHKRLKQLNNKTHFQFMTTTVVEIENVLSDKILKKFLIEGLKKDKNKVEAHTFQCKDYKDEHLGNYLTKFKNLNLPDSLKEKSGTLTTYYKNKLSQFVLEKVESGNIGWDDIKENRYAKKLTEAVYSFITKHNQ